MKYLLVTIGCFFCLAMSAQTGFVEFPYNPDSDGDDLIGTADLLDLLALYGLEFSEEDLYLNDDSTTAIYYAGSMMFSDCFRNCSQLPSNWKIPSAEQIMQFDLSMLNTYALWLDGPMSYHTSILSTEYYTINTTGRIMRENYDNSYNCYCYTHERPKVEYSYCEGTNIQECADSKMLDGWYPLGGPAYRDTNSPNKLQAFWRWAE
jgi:hypothetical protein